MVLSRLFLLTVTALLYASVTHSSTDQPSVNREATAASPESQCPVYSIKTGQTLSWAIRTAEKPTSFNNPLNPYQNQSYNCFVLRNTGHETLLLAAHLENPRMNFAELHSVSGGIIASSQLGTDYPLALWGESGTDSTFNIELKPGTESRHELHIGSKSPYNTSIHIIERKNLLKTLALEKTVAGILSGMIGILTIYFLFLSISTKDKAFFYLAGSTASVTLMQLNDLGILYSLWPRSIHWNQTCSMVFAVLSTIFGNCLARNYLDTLTTMPRIDRVMKWFGWYIFLFTLPLSFSNRVDLVTLFFVPAALAFMILLLAISITRILQGFKPARLYLMAYLLPLISGIFIVLITLGIIPSSTLSHLLPITGTAVQLILFSLALGEKINWLNEEQSTAHFSELKSRTERQAKRHFLAQISHELRTPLIGIIGLTELVDKDQHTDSEVELINGMERSARNLLNLTNTLLDHARLDANKWEIHSHEFSLTQLLGDIIEKNMPAAKQKNLVISTHIHENVPAVIRGDSFIITRILQELLDNAIKFTPSGSIAILVENTSTSLTNESSPTAVANIRFEVIDTGLGFDASFQSRIFEMFELADASSTRHQQGSGIGLSLCKKFCALLGGTIGCESHQGKGTVFWFSVPFGLSTGELASVDSSAKPTLPLNHFLHSGKNLLIAEDDAAIQLVLCALLDKLGVHKHEAFDNGQKLVERYRQDYANTALVLLDWNMPVMNGYQTLQSIRTFEQENNLPAVSIAFMSAYDAQNHLTDVLGREIPVLYKPVTTESLKQLLDIV